MRAWHGEHKESALWQLAGWDGDGGGWEVQEGGDVCIPNAT